VNNKKWCKWCKFVSPFLFNNTYGLPVLTIDTKSLNQVIYVWLVDLQSICAKWEVETWSSPNDDIRKYLLYKKNNWTKYLFWDVIKKQRRKWGKFVCPLLFNNTYDLPVFITDTKYPNQVLYVSLVDLQTICAKNGLEKCFSPNDDIRKFFVDMKDGWTKNVFCNVNNT
jgi:hypothetical protein